MLNILNSFHFIVFISLCPSSWTLLTGTHYLTTIHCSPSTLYIPQGPYMFSHHWPFTSISVHYDREKMLGTCYRDGSLSFTLQNGKTCSGIYYAGQAKLLCRADGDDFCFINMKSADGSPLTCSASNMKLKFIGLSLLSLLFVLLIL